MVRAFEVEPGSLDEEALEAMGELGRSEYDPIDTDSGVATESHQAGQLVLQLEGLEPTKEALDTPSHNQSRKRKPSGRSEEPRSGFTQRYDGPTDQDIAEESPDWRKHLETVRASLPNKQVSTTEPAPLVLPGEPDPDLLDAVIASDVAATRRNRSGDAFIDR